MGDRCYMTVHCNVHDKILFENVGFTAIAASLTLEAGTIMLVDEESNYAHQEDITTRVPWIGRSEAGSCYGATEWACDGSTLLEYPSGNEGGYVIGWTANGPDQNDLDLASKFHAFKMRVQAMLGVQTTGDSKQSTIHII